MNCIKTVLSLIFMAIALTAFSQSDVKNNAITSEWEAISLGKLQKKPRFKEPMISVRFISEEGSSFLHLSLKYMFTDAVFEEAVPVEYYKNEKLECVTDNGKYELKAARYAKARRMSTVAQKTADIRVIFSGDLSFLSNNLVKTFTVHYAQGYQHIDLNTEEATHLKEAYNKFLSMLPKKKEVPNVKIEGVAPKAAKLDTIQSNQNSLDRIRKQARNWRK
ncbi:hypothetical protein JGH11_02460 [Dysgonomonas sp. Marseille-P4677]|uniref:hypothetical protein n=1 Tax=Dysgonomonas sp. Marseille-P4677 TaxID=2364790 RepID=UPI0019123F67|nr:hypothetical protein [Dysgonomonas sp. Marseille-P4677]MBK5719729.1 hypothetical protein [Dysgonomonas sp. Marseille-P4677]